MEVGVACEIKLLSVDDVSETFHVALLIHTHWKDTQYVSKDAKKDTFEREPEYKGELPKIVLVNLVEGGDFDCVIRVRRSTQDVWAAFQTVCHINESLELFQFPFDRQLFRVGFKSPNAQFKIWSLALDDLDFPDQFKKPKSLLQRVASKSMAMLPAVQDGDARDDLEAGEGEEEDDDDEAIPNDSPFLVSCELNTWKMQDVEVGIYSEDADPVSLTRAELEIMIKAERDPIFFLCNYVLVMYLIVLLNACSAAIGVDEPADRLAFSSALLLTAVAFKFTLSSTLPKVGYQTYLDAYILLAFAFLAVGALEQVVVAPQSRCLSVYFGSDQTAEQFAASFDSCKAQATVAATRLDGIFQLIYVVCWTLINLASVVVSYIPSLVRPEWDFVIRNQIGETEETVKRTTWAWDYDNSLKSASGTGKKVKFGWRDEERFRYTPVLKSDN